jgi:hypothetical protein
MLTVETESGVGVARFEVQNPRDWERSLKSVPKSKS